MKMGVDDEDGGLEVPSLRTGVMVKVGAGWCGWEGTLEKTKQERTLEAQRHTKLC